MKKSRIPVALAALLVSLSIAVSASGQLVVFGDSLSDPGNHFIYFGTTAYQPFMTVPDASYAIGGHHFSNGATWAEQLATATGTPNSGSPALRTPGVFTNYAVGRSRARQCATVPAACAAGQYPFGVLDLKFQVDRFLLDSAGNASPDDLYVIWIGNNDLQDALGALQNDPTGVTSMAIIQAALQSEAAAIQTLYAAGARKFLVPTVANFGLTPAVRALGPTAQYVAALFAVAYNGALDQLMTAYGALPGIRFVSFDVNALLANIEANPASFGIANANDPCLKFDVTGDAICARPNDYLFWDGIHPTKHGHSIVAAAIRQVSGQ